VTWLWKIAKKRSCCPGPPLLLFNKPLLFGPQRGPTASKLIRCLTGPGLQPSGGEHLIFKESTMSTYNPTGYCLWVTIMKKVWLTLNLTRLILSTGEHEKGIRMLHFYGDWRRVSRLSKYFQPSPHSTLQQINVQSLNHDSESEMPMCIGKLKTYLTPKVSTKRLSISNAKETPLNKRADWPDMSSPLKSIKQ